MIICATRHRDLLAAVLAAVLVATIDVDTREAHWLLSSLECTKQPHDCGHLDDD